MKKLLKVCLAFSMCLAVAGCSEDDADSDMLTIGVLQLAEHSALDASYEGFVDGLATAGYVDGENINIVFENAQGDSSNCVTIADKLVNDGSDLIYAIATTSAQAVASATTDIPVVVSAITDPESAGLVESNELSGTNVCGASDLGPIEAQLELLLDVVPDAETIAIMYCSSEDNSIYQAEIAQEILEGLGVNVEIATVSDSSTIQQVTESLVGKVDGIYIPTDNLLAEYMSSVALVANENGIPTVVGEGGMVTAGGLASIALDYYELGVLAGEQAALILNGESVPSEMSIVYLDAESCELQFNQDVIDQLGITIDESLLEGATIVTTE